MAEPRHHPSEAWLLDFACGALERGFAAVVASHASVCSSCRATIDLVRSTNERLITQSPSITPRLSAAAVRAVPDAVFAPVPVGWPAQSPDLVATVARDLDLDWSTLNWQRGVPRKLYIAEPLVDRAARIWLLRAPPGVAVPAHYHQGAELTLVVCGSYRSGSDEFGPGDVDEGILEQRHQLRVGGSEECVCLMVFEASPRYTGWLGYAQKLLGF